MRSLGEQHLRSHGKKNKHPQKNEHQTEQMINGEGTLLIMESKI